MKPRLPDRRARGGSELATATRRVALVSVADESRTTLALYLKSAGFDVHESIELVVPFDVLVLLSDEDSSERVVAQVRSWMRLTKTARIVVVTSRPIALRDLVAAHSERLRVLPAPVFGWEIVDALRSTEAPRPRRA